MGRQPYPFRRSGSSFLRFLISLLTLCPALSYAGEETSTGWERLPDNRALKVVDTADIHDFTDKWTGSQLYPSQVGIPGWPGMTVEKGNAANLDEELKKRIEKWGFPERIPYPGSVEHVRVATQRYMPVVPRYNARTLLRNFRATDLPGVAQDRIVEYEEPIYFVSKYPWDLKHGLDSFHTGLKNKAVQVVKWDQSHPPFELDLGRLGPGVYAVRVIAATPTENVERSTRRLVIHFSINDGPKGLANEYRKRCAAIDEFYSVVEFYFIAPEARRFRAELRMDESSRMPLLVYNLDLHDRLILLAHRAGKNGSALYDSKRRMESWGGPHPDGRTREAKLAADSAIWNARLPLNAQIAMYGYVPGWEALFRSAQHVIPQGASDDGMGIDVYNPNTIWHQPEEMGKGDWVVALTRETAPSLHLTRQTWYGAAWGLETSRFLPDYHSIPKDAASYHETGNEGSARSAAVHLASVALTNMTQDTRQTMMAIDTIPLVGSGHGDVAFRRREKEMIYALRGLLPEHVGAYDQIFPYIQANAEDLAESLGRFIPWIHTGGDLLKFYDTCLLQFHAEQIMAYHQFLDSPTPGWMSKVIAVQQDPEIARPWVEWLFRYVWTYPNIPMGVDEIAVNNIGRDGGDRKGSVFYTLEGSFLPDLMGDLAAYTAQGGTLPLDMTNPQRFPKVHASRTFQEDVKVAGGYSFWIGDVSGPSRPRKEGDPKNPSRVLADWFGVLETGLEQNDFRFRRAAGVRVGYGIGHHHDDPLDLQIWAHGAPMCGDGGGRTGYAVPANVAVESHNTVASSLATQTLHRWVSSFVPVTGAQYLEAQVKCDGFYGRQLALIDVDGGQPAQSAADWPVTPNSYVVDVFRVRGGDRPHYGFHGPPADELKTNAEGRKKADIGGFLDPETMWDGSAPETFTATWRMRRDPEEIAFKNQSGGERRLNVPGAERMAMNENLMGRQITEDVPRKFIRMLLLGHQGARTWGARAYCLNGETFTNENVYVDPAKWEGATVFPVIFEPYAGENFIQSVRMAHPSVPLTDSDAVVVFEVALKNGRKDWIFFGRRGSEAVEVQGIGTFQAEFGYVSWEKGKLRQTVLTGGTRLEVNGLSIVTSAPAYEGTVKSVDYRARTAALNGALPECASGAVLEIGQAVCPTTYTLDSVKGTEVTFKKGMDLAMSRVREFLEGEIPVLQSQIVQQQGLTATDDLFRNWWRIGPPIQARGKATGLSAAAGGQAHPSELKTWELAAPLVDGPKPKDALKIGDALWVWEFGPGDAYRLPAQVSIQRNKEGKYEVTGNIPAKVKVGNKKWKIRP